MNEKYCTKCNQHKSTKEMSIKHLKGNLGTCKRCVKRSDEMHKKSLSEPLTENERVPAGKMSNQKLKDNKKRRDELDFDRELANLEKEYEL